jgi:uncharacterized protein
VISRKLYKKIIEYLQNFKIVGLLGPRQCGKTTLTKIIMQRFPDSIYLDLEQEETVNEILADPQLFFKMNSNKLICLDEINHLPEIFKVLRGIVDENPKKGQFLILGSASYDLLRQSSETLAGRVAYFPLTPFLYSEILGSGNLFDYWLRGGFPDSLLASGDEISLKWRKDFIYTFLNRDIQQFKLDISPQTLEKLWTLCAHNHGTMLNYSNLAQQIGIDSRTAIRYFEILESTYMVRKLKPFGTNIKSKIVKTPKLYIRDTGILHALLNISDGHSLLANSKVGESWEGMVIENLINEFLEFEPYFYRTANKSEIDLILQNNQLTFAVECKSSSKPDVTRGFWTGLNIVKPDFTYIAAPVETPYPFHGNEKITVGSLKFIIDDIVKKINLKKREVISDIDKNNAVISLLKKQ